MVGGQWSIVRQLLHHVWPRVSHLTNDNLLCKCCTLQGAALGQESFKCEKLCQPHRTGPQQEQRDCLLESLSPDRTSVRRLEGQKCLSDSQMSQMWHTSACRVQTNPFGNLGSLGGWTLGSTNVKGGLHLVLTRSPKNYKLLCTSSQEPILVRGITSVYGQRCNRSNSKSLGFFNLAWSQNHTTIGDLL